MTGLPLDGMFRLVSPDIGDADVERYRLEYRTRYDAEAIPMTRLYRAARHVARLARRGAAAGDRHREARGTRWLVLASRPVRPS